MTEGDPGIRTILAGQGWKYPEGYRPDNIARCRSCDKQVLWCITPKGKRMPVDRDGVSHFATCPAADQWRRKPGRAPRRKA